MGGDGFWCIGGGGGGKLSLSHSVWHASRKLLHYSLRGLGTYNTDSGCGVSPPKAEGRRRQHPREEGTVFAKAPHNREAVGIAASFEREVENL